jgi:hypothetical protein
MPKRGERCKRQRCSKPVRAEGLCAIHAKHEADRLFSLMIRARDERCVRCGETYGLQCCHKVSRRYMTTRYSPANAVAMDVKCHMWQTHNPLEGDVFFDSLTPYNRYPPHRFSPLSMAELRLHALNDPVPDIADVLAELRSVT